MLDLGWSELLIISVVALVVVGPKDLPKMFRTLGQLTGKARAMARDFQRAMDAAADEVGVKDVAKTFRETASGKTLRDAVGFDEIDRELRDIGHDRPEVRSGAKPASKSQPKAGAKPSASGAGSDPGAVAGDDDLGARNAAMTETEIARLQRAERAAAARQQAAELRARREAAASPATGATPDPAAPKSSASASAATATPPASDPEPPRS